ncbi:MAG: carbamoyl-phosphate synthase (glutamine-hydrolyzing) large subunit [Candidatus Zixiibacteriota bacterium]|nr:MAG: carbamoyl-phosphate synthase (glutamine-hydrolyzing) large subunit [candidate division Zixibacteria bacterium]
MAKLKNAHLVKSVLVLGSSALKIGEAGEFDYSGSQAIKALREEGIGTILINPNIATIQTSEQFADEVYFLPVTPEFVEKVIESERPDGILLGFGGQTALNCGIELYRRGVLERNGVQVLGAPIESILDTEDRQRFISRLGEIDVDVPRSQSTTSVSEAIEAAGKIGYPCMARGAFALGGLGSGICRSEDELCSLAERAFAHTSQLLIEEYLEGWKEIEYEVVRDSHDNCVTVCNMENLDPMGIHTGESIVVAPSQTLNNDEYQMLRNTAIGVVRHLGIVGECNIQYALAPDSRQYRVIEVNARLSRSSALASKATGYPLAFVAAKLALGKSLTEVKNSVTQKTWACFEPALDYVVVKAPRWDLKKFPGASERIGSAMKSVGEVMAIGRKFEEALQKAMRMLETGARGVVLNNGIRFGDLPQSLQEPTEQRIFAIAEAIKAGMSIDEIHRITNINKWFIEKIANLTAIEQKLRTAGSEGLTSDLLLEAKRFGFSDAQIGVAIGQEEVDVSRKRRDLAIRPCVKQIDTLAAEYPARTNYLYLTYNGSEDDVEFGEEGIVMMLGPGAYRIGSSVEFDWCCVNAVRTLRELGYRTLMVNYNPETVSTDYDECDRLYFDELSFETVSEIYDKEKPVGMILSMGGQIPNSLAMKCHTAGMRVLGTSPCHVDQAEDRHKFSSLLEQMKIPQPAWRELRSLDEIREFADKTGYPVIVRPSYVLSGAAMAVAGNDEELESYLEKAVSVSPDHPVVVSKFIENAKEVDIDAVARDGKLVCWAVSEHVENAGVHSGDATLVLPPQRTYLETMRQIRKVSTEIASSLSINGPFNIQFLAKNNQVMVIECNLRCSRSFPFVSKVLKRNFVDAAVRVVMGHPVQKTDQSFLELDYVGVKAPEFSFSRLDGADPTLGVEMASTGEVACLGWDFDEAFLKALISVGYRFPLKSVLLSTGPIESKAAFIEGASCLRNLGVEFYATGGTAEFMTRYGFQVSVLRWPLEGGSPNALDHIKDGKIDLVINIPKDYRKEELTNDYLIRRTAVDFGVPLITNLQLAQRLAESLGRVPLDRLEIHSWHKYGGEM